MKNSSTVQNYELFQLFLFWLVKHCELFANNGIMKKYKSYNFYSWSGGKYLGRAKIKFSSKTLINITNGQNSTGSVVY